MVDYMYNGSNFVLGIIGFLKILLRKYKNFEKTMRRIFYMVKLLTTYLVE